MTSIAKLKDRARKHEQKEDWAAAIQAYQQVIEQEQGEDEVDLELTLYNRIGDLYLRLGRTEEAVSYYETAADKYAESGFFNNAIALCNKALRHRPERPEIYLKLSGLCAQQGFLTDARRWIIEYAERRMAAGQPEKALSGLENYAEDSNDPEIRELLAQHLASHDRADEAIEQLRRAHAQRVARGESDAAAAVAGKAREIDPDVDLAGAAPAGEPEPADGGLGLESHREAPPEAPDVSGVEGLEATAMDAEAGEEAGEPASVSGLEGHAREVEADEAAVGGVGGLETFEETEAAEDEFEPVEDDVEPEPLPLLDAGPDEEEAEPLPLLDDSYVAEDEAAVDDEGPGFTEAPPGAPAEPTEAPEPAAAEADASAPETPVEEAGVQPGEEAPAGEPADEPEFVPEEIGAAGAYTSEVEEDSEEPPELDPDDDIPYVEPMELGSLDLGIGVSDVATPERELDVEATIGRARELVSRGLRNEAMRELALLPRNDAGPEAFRKAIGVMNEVIRHDANDVDALQRRVEFAVRAQDRGLLVDAYTDLADALARLGAETKAQAMYQRVLDLDPENTAAREAVGDRPVEADEMIDLDAVLREMEPEEREAAESAGDSAPASADPDFSAMLSQFKAKASEEIGANEAGDHYDLGLAFKEMGLIDEAIAEFQTALKGGTERLKVYEELGQCFMQKGQYTVALKVLNRALKATTAEPSELLGVYYHMGQCHEELGQRAEARAAYEKVLMIDATFEDVPARVARL